MFEFARLVLEADSRQIRQAENDLKGLRRTSRDVDAAVDTNVKSWERWGRVTGAAIGSVVGLSFAGMVRELYDVNVQFEKSINTLKFATGSAEAAQREYDLLRETANKLGLEVSGLQHGFSQMIAAAKGTDVSLESINTLFKGVADASRTLGLSTSETEGIINALSQTITKNKVQWEELRGQLGDRMPGAIALTAQALGTTTEGLTDMIKKGIDAKTFVEALGPAMEQTFGVTATEAAGSAQSQMARFHNEIQNLYRTVGQSGVMDAFADILKAMADVLRDPEVIAGAKSIGESIAEMIRSITKDGSAVKEFFNFTGTATKGLADDFKTLLDIIHKVDTYFKGVGDRIHGRQPLVPDTSGMTPGLLQKWFGSSSSTGSGSAGGEVSGDLMAPDDGLGTGDATFFAPRAPAMRQIGVEFGSLQFDGMDDLVYGRRRRPDGSWYSFTRRRWEGGSAHDIAEELARPFKYAADSAEHAFSDVLGNAFSNKKVDFGAFGQSVADSVRGAFSQSISHLIFSQMQMPFAGVNGGGAGGAGGGGGGLFGTQLFGGTTLGQAMGGGLMGYGIGSMIGNFSPFGKTGMGSGIGGAIGGIAGSFFGPLGTMIGSVGGGLLGSLFGPHPSVGPGQAATLAYTSAANVYGASADNGGNAAQAVAQLSALGETISRIVEAAGGTGLAGGGRSVSLGSNKNGFFLRTGGQTSDTVYGSQQDAEMAALRYLLGGGVAGASATFNKVIQSGKWGSAQELEQAVGFAKLYDQLTGMKDETTGAAKALEDLRKTFSDARIQAEKFGLSVADLDAGLAKATSKMRDDFNQSIANEILAINDKNAAALAALDQEFDQRRKDAQALGADINKVEELYGLRRRQIIEQTNGAITDSVTNMATDLRKLLDNLQMGPDSALSPADRYAMAAQAFSEAEQMGRDTGRLPANFSEIMSRFLDQSKLMFASTERYAQDYERATSLLTDLLGMPRRALGGFGEGMTIVGEAGPELVRLPVGSRVFGRSERPANDNAEMTRLLQALQASLAGSAVDTRAMRDLMERLLRKLDMALSSGTMAGMRSAVRL